MSSDKLRIGIIGVGSIANAAHFPAFAMMDDVEIVGVLGRNRNESEVQAKKHGIPFAAGDLKELMDQKLDAAVLLTPKYVRREYLEPLLAAKLDVLVEKPLASTLQECEALADISAKSGQIVMVAFNRRYSPVTQRGVAEFADKKPHLMVASKSREFKEYRATLENSIHMVDMMRYVMGECHDVQAESGWTIDELHEDYCAAKLSFDHGVGMLCASREAGQWYERMELFGGNKTVIIESPDRLTIVRPDYEEVYNSTPLKKGWANYVEQIGFYPCDRHFIECVKTRQKPLTSAEDALKTHQLMNEILRKAGLPDLTKEWPHD